MLRPMAPFTRCGTSLRSQRDTWMFSSELRCMDCDFRLRFSLLTCLQLRTGLRPPPHTGSTHHPIGSSPKHTIYTPYINTGSLCGILHALSIWIQLHFHVSLAVSDIAPRPRRFRAHKGCRAVAHHALIPRPELRYRVSKCTQLHHHVHRSVSDIAPRPAQLFSAVLALWLWRHMLRSRQRSKTGLLSVSIFWGFVLVCFT